jgi:choloylglycine hydrolase
MSRRAALAFVAVALAATPLADACTRILYESGSKDYIVGRSMDWYEDTKSDLWAFPKGMRRDGGVGDGSILWVSRYGSVVTSIYNVATVDGINEAGLVGNMLYLAEADYGANAMAGKASLSIGAWLQYVLDNYATVDDAVSALRAEPFRIIAPNLPDGKPASAHLAISDASGDSAIFEYVKGKLTIHHGPQFTVMTNSPIYDKQLAINTYWDEVGGMAMLPGTYRAADRFVRASFNLSATPKFKDHLMARSCVFSMIRNISVPLGISDPQKPNIATTIWRTVSDSKERRYYFDSALSPNVFWVDLAKLNLSPGARPSKLELQGDPVFAGEASAKFKPAESFPWLAP